MSAFGAVSSRKLFLCTLAALLCLSSATAWAQQAISTPILSSAPNFRDLAGIAKRFGGTGSAETTSNNGFMRTGVFYRTDALNKLTNSDWQIISSLGIVRDIDLRTPSEILSAQDVVPQGAAYTNINIYGTQSPDPEPFTASPDEAIKFMEKSYRYFVTKKVQREGFRRVMLTLASDSGADIWHCSGGKDRTGWTSMILQSIAGVSQADIMNDYLATNTYTATAMSIAKAELLAKFPTLNPATIDALLGVDSNYLEAGLEEVNLQYGSMDAYLTQGLGLTRADIYVLRARMVYYPTLPGQGAFAGNEASGAALLNALQNSPLSGHYTPFNFFLQSAVDAGTLSGVQAQVGGQVHADASSFLLRQPRFIDEAVMPYTSGRDLLPSQSRVWMTALGGNFSSNGDTGIADSSENTAGTLIGATYRLSNQASVNMGIGYSWGSVESADARATLNTLLGTVGGRYAFSSLETGPYLVARADIGWVNYDSKRTLGGGLGTPTGDTQGALFSGLAGVGDVFRLDPFTITLQTGFRITHANLGGFNENGSSLALGVDEIDKTSSSVLIDLDISLDRQQLNAWTVEPSLILGYERFISDPQVESTGSLFGFSVSQVSAFNSHDLVKAGLGVSAQRGTFTVRAGVNGTVGTGSGSAGIGGQLSVGYSF